MYHQYGLMPPGFTAPNHNAHLGLPSNGMYGGLNPVGAPPPHLPGSQGAMDYMRHKINAAAGKGPIQHGFSPYEDNGGTCIGVSGKDFAILGSDSRLSRGYNILTRESSKSIQLTDKCVLTSAGMKADRDQLHKVTFPSSSRTSLTSHDPEKHLLTTLFERQRLIPCLLQMLKTRLVMYEHQHGKPMSTPVSLVPPD